MTKTEICNRALNFLGESPIIDIESSGPNNVSLRNAYTFALEDSLRSHTWNFALARVSLAQLSSTPIFGYTYQYQLPSDFLKLKETDSPYPHTIEGDMLLSDDTTMSIIYIKRITDTEKFDSSFANYLAVRLARELAYNITAEATVSDRIEALYKEAKREAKKNDGQESKPIVFTNKQYGYRTGSSGDYVTLNAPDSIQTPL